MAGSAAILTTVNDARRDLGAAADSPLVDVHGGDTKLTWTDDPDDIRRAREVFDQLTRPSGRSRRYEAFRVGEEGRGERLTRFEPDAGELVLIPQAAGG